MSYEDDHPLNEVTHQRWCNIYGGLIQPGKRCRFCANKEDALSQAWSEAFQIQKCFTDYLGIQNVPEAVMQFTNSRLHAINEMTRPDVVNTHLLTEQEIVDRAADRENTRRFLLFWLIVFSVAALFAFWLPVHIWLHSHLELLVGILIGSLAEAIIWIACTWKRL